MQKSNWVLIGVVLSLAGLLTGCGPGNPQGRKAVTGTVTLNGEPIEAGSIDFQPVEGGDVSSGAVISNGNFSIEEEQGLPAGKYKVTVFASNPDQPELPPGYMPGDDLPPQPPPKQVVPPDWSETIEVKEGAGPVQLEFKIETKGAPKKE